MDYELQMQQSKNEVGEVGNSYQVLSSKEIAEVQAQMIIAKQFPRNMIEVENKIKQNCERKSLAEVSEYQYPRGKETVRGASIRLIEVIAQCLGNIQWGWEEVERITKNGIPYARIRCQAWDIQNNAKQYRNVDVALVRDKKDKNNIVKPELVTAERDIYELCANNAARRVRACLEGIIPRDFVDMAIECCRATKTSNTDFQKSINQAIEFFRTTYKVELSQIEEYFGCSRDCFNKDHYVSLREIATTLKDKMAKVEDFFPNKETEIKNNAEKEAKVKAEAGQKVMPKKEDKTQEEVIAKNVEEELDNQQEAEFNIFGN